MKNVTRAIAFSAAMCASMLSSAAELVGKADVSSWFSDTGVTTYSKSGIITGAGLGCTYNSCSTVYLNKAINSNDYYIELNCYAGGTPCRASISGNSVNVFSRNSSSYCAGQPYGCGAAGFVISIYKK